MQGSTRMRVALMLLVAVGAALPASAQLIPRPASVSLGVNYTADISNSPPGSCGCFAMQGGGVNVRLGLNRPFLRGGRLLRGEYGHSSPGQTMAWA